MMRTRDHVRLSLQKLTLRKRRAAFAIVSVALGVIVVVTVNSLIEGVRDVALKTLWTEDIPKNVIKVYSTENPYEIDLPTRETKEKAKKRFQFLTEAAFEEIRGWSGVLAADRPVTVQPVSIDALSDRPRPVTMLEGRPDALLRQYMSAEALAACTNAIPLVIGERNVRLRFNEKKTKLELDNAQNPTNWIGRDVTITLGDSFAQLPRYRYDYERREFHRFSDEELAAHHDGLERTLRAQYDATIYGATLSLKGRIVGLCQGNDVMIPLDTAVLCEKWLDQRRRLASWRPSPAAEDIYEVRGRRVPHAGEYTEGIVVVKDAANIEAVAKRIEELGFSTATRASAFENQAQMFDSSIRMVRRVAFAFGALILGLACGLLWSTTSKIVSDSRADIGLFRALGATKADVRRLFLGETALLGVLGTVVGIAAGWTLAFSISRWVLGYVRAEITSPEEALLIPDSIFSFNMRFCVLLLLGAAIVSLASGLWPANRAANVDPVKALKRE